MSPSAKEDREPEAGSVEDIKQEEQELLLHKEDLPSTDEPSGPPPTEAEADAPFPLADAGPYFIGMWGDYPNYGCPYCLEAQLADSPEQGTGIIELHILSKIDAGDVRHMAALDKK